MSNMESSNLTSPGTSALLAPVAIGIVFITWLVKCAHAYTSSKGHRRKHPPQAPLGILQTIKMFSSADLPLKYLELFRTMNSSIVRLNLPLPGHPMVVAVNDPATVRQILTDLSTVKPASIYGQLIETSPAKSPSLFALNGEPWHRRRKGAMPAFSSKHVRRMNDVALDATEAWLRNRLLPMIDKDQSFNIGEEMMKVILSALSKTAFEYDMSEEEMVQFMHDSETVNEEYFLKSASNPLRKYFWWMLPERQRAFKSCQSICNLIARIMDSYRKLESPMEGTLIDQIMSNPVYADDNERTSDIWVYLVAGHDTTANTLAFTLLELAKQPGEQDRLREALKKLPEDKWNQSGALKMVIKESMRLNPVAAATVARSIGRSMVVTNEKYFLPENTLAMLPIFALTRNCHVYGDDADAFRPSRWEDPTKEMFDAFLPFALGKQNCAGQSLANAELHCILARIISEFEFFIKEEGSADFFVVWKPVGVRLKARRV